MKLVTVILASLLMHGDTRRNCRKVGRECNLLGITFFYLNHWVASVSTCLSDIYTLVSWCCEFTNFIIIFDFFKWVKNKVSLVSSRVLQYLQKIVVFMLVDLSLSQVWCINILLIKILFSLFFGHIAYIFYTTGKCECV